MSESRIEKGKLEAAVLVVKVKGDGMSYAVLMTDEQYAMLVRCAKTIVDEPLKCAELPWLKFNRPGVFVDLAKVEKEEQPPKKKMPIIFAANCRAVSDYAEQRKWTLNRDCRFTTCIEHLHGYPRGTELYVLRSGLCKAELDKVFEEASVRGFEVKEV